MSEDTLLAISAAVFAVFFAWLAKMEKKHKVGEARFDSETGKQIKDD